MKDFFLSKINLLLSALSLHLAGCHTASKVPEAKYGPPPELIDRLTDIKPVERQRQPINMPVPPADKPEPPMYGAPKPESIKYDEPEKYGAPNPIRNYEPEPNKYGAPLPPMKEVL